MGETDSPTGRALRALALLQAQPGVTAARLADHLGVSERAARRYVALLREAEIPVESTRGRYGGYRLGRGVRLPPLVFSSTEALGLVMAVLDNGRAAPGTEAGDAVGTALGKLLRALPEPVARDAALVRREAATVPSRDAPPPAPEIAAMLAAAVAGQRAVHVDYRGASGRAWTERVDPWAVVVRHGHWYLLCHSHRVAAVRAYRLDRVAAVRAGGPAFRPPAGLDPVALLEQHLASGWDFETRVAFDAPVEEVAPWIGAPMGRLTPADGGGCVLTGTTSNPGMYAGEWLAAIPLAFRVLGGAELRTAVGEVAARLHGALAAPGDELP